MFSYILDAALDKCTWRGAEVLLVKAGLNVNRLHSCIHEIKRNYQEGRGFSIHENDTAIKCITRFQGLVKILKLVLGQDSEDV